jgi:hypothetical protein
MYSAGTPDLKPGHKIFRDEYGPLFRLTDELVFFRSGLGSDKRQRRAAIRSCNQDETAMLSGTICNQPEPKLLEIESEASILIAN